MMLARLREASLGAGPMSVTLPLAVSTSIFTALKSGSFIRPADTDAVIAASSLLALALFAACFAASLA